MPRRRRGRRRRPLLAVVCAAGVSVCAAGAVVYQGIVLTVCVFVVCGRFLCMFCSAWAMCSFHINVFVCRRTAGQANINNSLSLTNNAAHIPTVYSTRSHTPLTAEQKRKADKKIRTIAIASMPDTCTPSILQAGACGASARTSICTKRLTFVAANARGRQTCA